MPRFSVWNGVSISRGYASMADVAAAVQALVPDGPRWSPVEWLVKAGEGGTYQRTWDHHPLAIGSAAELGQRIKEGAARGIRVVPYIVVRGRADWRGAEHQQIVECAAVARRVVLNLEEGASYWNGPTNQQELQETWIWPLEEALRRTPRARTAEIEICAIPRRWVVDALGGLPCLAAWLAFARRASWECYDAIADDLDVAASIARVTSWGAETGWGKQPRFKIPVVQRSRIEAWAGTKYARYGLEVWHLDGD
jgi:hypothetical protein